MPKHSRNNTAGSVFTYAERQMVKDGSKKERLGRDSMRVRTRGHSLMHVDIHPSQNLTYVLNRITTHVRCACNWLEILVCAQKAICSAR